MTHSTPGSVMERLEQIDRELGEIQNDYEASAGERARLIKRWEYRLAVARTRAKGSDADARKAAALVAAAEHTDDDEEQSLYERLIAAEAMFEASRAAVKVRETRATIGQSILKAQGRG